MNEILNADDTMLAQLLFNDGVVSYGNALLVDLAIATLVDQLPHTLQIWVPKKKNKLLPIIQKWCKTGFSTCSDWLQNKSHLFVCLIGCFLLLLLFFHS